jgi:hypothetical protein
MWGLAGFFAGAEEIGADRQKRRNVELSLLFLTRYRRSYEISTKTSSPRISAW